MPKFSDINWSTRSYVASHGREPRGTGSWMFCPITRWKDGNYLDFVLTAPPGLTLAKAKRAVADQCIANGWDTMVVCP